MPKAHLQPLDWFVIGAYFVVLISIGLFYRRFASRSHDDSFLSGRRNSGWANGVSYAAAAMMNADVAPAYSGLALALLGAGPVMLMTQGLSFLYVARYGEGVAALAAFVIGGAVLLVSYGRYLDRLEGWADGPPLWHKRPACEYTGETPAPHEPQPPRTSAVVALVTTVFDLVILLGGVLATRGHDLVFNLAGGSAFLLAAVVIWSAGRPG